MHYTKHSPFWTFVYLYVCMMEKNFIWFATTEKGTGRWVTSWKSAAAELQLYSATVPIRAVVNSIMDSWLLGKFSSEKQMDGCFWSASEVKSVEIKVSVATHTWRSTLHNVSLSTQSLDSKLHNLTLLKDMNVDRGQMGSCVFEINLARTTTVLTVCWQCSTEVGVMIWCSTRVIGVEKMRFMIDECLWIRCVVIYIWYSDTDDYCVIKRMKFQYQVDNTHMKNFEL